MPLRCPEDIYNSHFTQLDIFNLAHNQFKIKAVKLLSDNRKSTKYFYIFHFYYFFFFSVISFHAFFFFSFVNLWTMVWVA